MPVYNSALQSNSLMEEIRARFSGIRAYERIGQGRYLQVVLPAGRWAGDEGRKRELNRRLREYAFSAGQETVFADCENGIDELVSDCDAKLSSGSWARVQISVVAAMSDADEQPEGVSSALDMATELKAYLDENYVLDSSVCFYGVFTAVRKIECSLIREKLAALQTEKRLKEIFHVVNVGEKEQLSLQTVAFASSLIPFCMDATDRDSEQYKFGGKLNGAVSAAGAGTPDKGRYSFKLIDSLLLNVEEAAAIKYAYDALTGQKYSDPRQSDWDKKITDTASGLLFGPIVERGEDWKSALKKIQTELMDKTAMLPVLPPVESGGISLFRKKNGRIITESPEELNMQLYGGAGNRGSTLEHYIDAAWERLRSVLEEYSAADFCRDLVCSCPGIDYARSVKFRDALRRAAESDFYGLFEPAGVSNELEARDSKIDILKKKSLYCRDYYIRETLNRHFSSYLKNRLSEAAKALCSEDDGTVNAVSDSLENEMLLLREGWLEYMGTEIEQAEPVIFLDPCVNPMDAVTDPQFSEKVSGMTDQQEANISSAFIHRAVGRIRNGVFIALGDTEVDTATLFIHRSDFSPPRGNEALDFSSDRIFYRMISAFSLRAFSANIDIRYYKYNKT